ncbi:MAG: glycoside hydrolase family 20 zincin-like fold domain-containing protein [Arachnia sp.]
MHPVRIAAGVATAVVLILTMVSPSSSAAPPGELITVPAVQQWTPGTDGTFAWAGTKLVVEAGNAELEEIAQTFAADIHGITGTKPEVAVGGTASAGSIVLAIGDQGHGDESYGLDISDSLTITGTSPHGAFNGTRSVLQLLRQGDIPHGTVLDWPDYEVRSVLFDQTPRHVSMAWWENFFKQMSYVKLNDTNLYLDGVGLDKAEMRAIDELGAKYYVKVVPQINMPSHMHVWLAAHPEYQLVNQDGSLNQTAIDLTNEEAVDWALNLIEEYVGLFQGDEWHLGSDEYHIRVQLRR